ncbi:MAG: hypothetical protein P8Z49_06655 [Acidobacteriota bacterium]
MDRQGVKEGTRFKGILTPGDRDDEFRITSYVLCTFDESEYTLVAGREDLAGAFSHCLYSKVEITGVLSLDDQGRNVIVVSMCHPVKGGENGLVS